MIIREQTVGPYRIGGFCNGAIVAYETARKLQSEGRELDLLILIDAPSWSFRPGVRTLLGCLRHLSVDVQAWGWFSRLEKAVSVAEKLRWAARGFLRRWRSVKATPSEMVSLIRRAEALARYRPQPMQVRAVYYAGDYAGSGWRQLLSGLQIVPIPGGHCGVLGEHIDLLATDLRIRLTG